MNYKDPDYKLFIYYVGHKDPTTIGRATSEALEKWLNNKHHRGNLKECSHWVIRNNEGDTILEGGVFTEVRITVKNENGKYIKQ
jgi:hypothetical protein